MIRTLSAGVAVFAVATLLSEVCWVGLLWYRGQLDTETIQEIRTVLSGRGDETSNVNQESQVQLSNDEVDRNRTMRILELGTRENELAILKSLIDQKALELIEQQQKLGNIKKTFESQLAQFEASNSSDATEQARAVLLKMESAEATEFLMQLDLAENVRLLKGMPDKNIAEILQAFNADTKQVDRARRIFEALTRGEPERDLINQTAEKTVPTDGFPNSQLPES